MRIVIDDESVIFEVSEENTIMGTDIIDDYINPSIIDGRIVKRVDGSLIEKWYYRGMILSSKRVWPIDNSILQSIHYIEGKKAGVEYDGGSYRIYDNGEEVTDTVVTTDDSIVLSSICIKSGIFHTYYNSGAIMERGYIINGNIHGWVECYASPRPGLKFHHHGRMKYENGRRELMLVMIEGDWIEDCSMLTSIPDPQIPC